MNGRAVKVIALVAIALLLGAAAFNRGGLPEATASGVGGGGDTSPPSSRGVGGGESVEEDTTLRRKQQLLPEESSRERLGLAIASQQPQQQQQTREVKAPFFEAGTGVDQPPKPTRAPPPSPKDELPPLISRGEGGGGAMQMMRQQQEGKALPTTTPTPTTTGASRYHPEGGYYYPKGGYPILRFPSTEINYALGPTVAEETRRMVARSTNMKKGVVEGDEKGGNGSDPSSLTNRLCSHYTRLPKKFLTFEPWPGGWNNRRLSLEDAAMLALLTNRTLVLPPLASNIHDDHVRGATMMGYEHAYNMSSMRYFLPAITFEELRLCGAQLLDSLPVIDEGKRSCSGVPRGSKDRFYCEKSVPVSRKAHFVNANGGHFYSIPAGHFTKDPKGHHRRPHPIPSLEPDSSSSGATIIHFQRNLLSAFSSMAYIKGNYIDGSVSLRPTHYNRNPRGDDATTAAAGSLEQQEHQEQRVGGEIDPTTSASGGGPSAAMGPPLTVKQRVFGAMRDGLQYSDFIKQAAANVVHKYLGGVDGFSAIHFRRKDFKLQYPHMVSEPCRVVANLAVVLNVGETIFIASDDDEEVHNAFKKCGTEESKGTPAIPLDLKFFSWSSLLANEADGNVTNFLGTDLISTTQVPLVVQEICVAARIFSPNAYSTLSGMIVRQRGYREAPTRAMGVYYTSIPLATVAMSPEELLLLLNNHNSSSTSSAGRKRGGAGRKGGTGRPRKLAPGMYPYNFPNKDGPTWGHETRWGFEEITLSGNPHQETV